MSRYGEVLDTMLVSLKPKPFSKIVPLEQAPGSVQARTPGEMLPPVAPASVCVNLPPTEPKKDAVNFPAR